MKAPTILAALLFAFPAAARWKAEYANVPQEVRNWYESRELTPEAQNASISNHAARIPTSSKPNSRSGAPVMMNGGGSAMIQNGIAFPMM